MADSHISDAVMPTPSAILMRHPWHILALGVGSGLAPVAPGTVATLWAWVVFLMIDPLLTDLAWHWCFWGDLRSACGPAR